MSFDGDEAEHDILEDDGPSVRTTIIYNALEPTDREIVDLAWEEGKTLADYMDGLPTDVDWVVVTPIGPIEPQDWDKYIPAEDDRIVLMLSPNKGIGQILMLVATIAIAIAAPYIGGFLATSVGLLSATMWSGIAAAALTGLLGVLVNALGAPVPEQNQNQDPNASPSYSLSGAKNTATEGIVLPLVYGEFRTGGNRVNFYTENSYDGKHQIAYMDFVVSEGEIESISNIEVNGQPFTNFTDIVTDYRTGTEDQLPIPWFTSSITPFSNGGTINNTTGITYTTISEVDRFRLDIVFPAGLFVMDQQNGSLSKKTVDLTVAYAPEGTDNWVNLPGDTTWVAIDPNAGNTPPCTGVRVTVQMVGSSSGGTTGFNAQVNYTNVSGYIDTSGNNFGWFGFGSNNYSDGIGAGQGSTGQVGNASGVITNVFSTDNAGIPGWTPGVETRTFELTGMQLASYDLSAVGGQIIAVEVLTPSPLKFTAADRNRLTYSIHSPPLPLGRYKITIIRNSAQSNDNYVSDQVILDSVNEIQTDPVAYIATAHYAVRVKITDQINSEPNVSALVKGRRVNIYDKNGNVLAYQWSDNPADIALDILLNWRNQYGIPLSRIDFAAFARMRAHCANNGYTFNGIFDWQTTVWDALMLVMRAGRANIIMSGVRWSVILDAPSEATMMFTMHNIIKDSFSTFWIGADSRYNSIEVTYYDKNDSYRRHSAFAMDQIAMLKGEPLRATTINGIGYVDAQRAADEAQLQLNKNMYLKQGAVFDVPIEAIGCVVGDVVYVQHDMPQWGYAAIIKGVNGNLITIDSDIPFNGESNWRMLLVNGARQIATHTITAKSGNQLVFGTSTFYGVHRLKIAGVDYEVLDEVVVGGELVITVDRGGDVQVGYAAEFWLTDLMCEATLAPVTAQSSRPLGGDLDTYQGFTLLTEDGDAILSEETGSEGVRQIQITGWVSTVGVPAVGDRVMIGQILKMKKPFWITKIGYADKHIRNIEAIEYNETIYDGVNAAPTPNYSALPLFPQHVMNLRAWQTSNELQGGAVQYFANCGWVRPLNDLRGYAGANIYVSANFEEFTLVATVGDGQETYTIPANNGDIIRFKVVSFDKLGISADLNTAPIAAVQIGTISRIPTAPSNVSVKPGIKQVSLSWTIPQDDYIKGVEIWENPFNDELSGAYIEWFGSANYFVRTGLTMGDTLHYWLRSVSITGQTSEWVGPFEASPTFALADDIGDAILTTAKFAADITPVELVTSLPTTGNFEGRLAFLLSGGDQELYIFRGGVWTKLVNKVDSTIIEGQLTSDQIADLAAAKISGQLTDAQIAEIAAAKITGQLTDAQIAEIAAAKISGILTDAQIAEIAATKITGQLTDAQIAEIAAAKLTGQITTTQIADNAISTPKLMAGSISSEKIAAGAITTDLLAANSVTATKLQAGSVVAGKLAADAVLADNIAANAVTSVKISAQAITTQKIAAGAVTADILAANSVTATKIAAGSVVAGKLAADAVLANNIAANSITTPKISAGAITTQKIAAGAVTTELLAVGSATNVCWNSCMEISSDGWSAWAEGGQVIQWGTTLGSALQSSHRLPVVGSGWIHSMSALAPNQHRMIIMWNPSSQTDGYNGIPWNPGDRIEVSAYIVTSGCAGRVAVSFYDSAGNWLAETWGTRVVRNSGTANKLSDYSRSFVMAVAPPNTAYANAFVFGHNDNGSDIYAPNIFNPYLFFTQFSVGPCPVNAVEPQPFSPGGVTSIHGGMVHARSIAADRIMANTITAVELAADSVIAGKIAAGAVNAREIAVGAIRADKLAAEEVITLAAQIRNALITTAHIGDLQVTTAKIGHLQVDTGNIASAAVTDMFTLTGVNNSGSDQNLILRQSTYIPSDGRIIVWSNMRSFIGASSGGSFDIVLYIDGSEVGRVTVDFGYSPSDAWVQNVTMGYKYVFAGWRQIEIRTTAPFLTYANLIGITAKK